MCLKILKYKVRIYGILQVPRGPLRYETSYRHEVERHARKAQTKTTQVDSPYPSNRMFSVNAKKFTTNYKEG